MTTNEAGFDHRADRPAPHHHPIGAQSGSTSIVRSSDQVIFDCIDLAEQAPSGGNDASRRWIVVRDEATKQRLGEIYARNGEFMTRVSDRLEGTGHGKEKVFNSSAYLVENFAKAPVLVIAAIWGIHDNSGRPGLFDSVIQSAWSFNLALRSRGLGSDVDDPAQRECRGVGRDPRHPRRRHHDRDLPRRVHEGHRVQAGRARRPAEQITYFDRWGFTRAKCLGRRRHAPSRTARGSSPRSTSRPPPARCGPS